MRLFELLAMAPPPAGTEPNPKGQMIQMIGMFAILGVMFYFLLIRPQQKQKKERERMLASIKKGDRVVTSSGMHGTVVGLNEHTVVLKVADQVKLEFDRSAIGRAVEGQRDKDA